MKNELTNAIVERLNGKSPAIITIRHDGCMTRLCGKDLPLISDRDKSDRGTLSLGFWAWMECAKKGCAPSILYNKIARNRCSPEIRGIFYEEAMRTVRKCLEEHGRCYVFDLHRFYKQPSLGDWDVFLGTNYGQTIESGLDAKFATVLVDSMWHGAKTMLTVYVPGNEPKDGERFMAAKPMTFVNWLKREEPRANAIQIEFYKDLLEDGALSDALACALANAIRAVVIQ